MPDIFHAVETLCSYPKPILFFYSKPEERSGDQNRVTLNTEGIGQLPRNCSILFFTRRTFTIPTPSCLKEKRLSRKKMMMLQYGKPIGKEPKKWNAFTFRFFKRFLFSQNVFRVCCCKEILISCCIPSVLY